MTVNCSDTSKSTSSKLLVFTDLDGTLLDEDYQWTAAKPVLAHLNALNFPLVLSSSKTLDEMTELAEALETGAPLIAENGGLVAIPKSGIFAAHHFGNISDQSHDIEFNGLNRVQVLDIAHRLRERGGYQFEGFHDWTAEQVVGATGLPIEDARRSMNRLATEPILWQDKEERWEAFERSLHDGGVRTVKGGRFTHLMGDTDKAMGLRRVLQLYQELEPDVDWRVVALGDSPNDLEMLNAADIAVVIPNSRHPAGLEPAAPRVVFASEPGPMGWNLAMQELLEPYLNHA